MAEKMAEEVEEFVWGRTKIDGSHLYDLCGPMPDGAPREFYKASDFSPRVIFMALLANGVPLQQVIRIVCDIHPNWEYRGQ